MNPTLLLCMIAILVSVAGCEKGPELGLVKGTVTLDGEPIKDVIVAFTPIQRESGGSAVVGPYSTATTNANGQYVLYDRTGNRGAVIGRHRVSFEYHGYKPGLEAELKHAIDDARQNGNEFAARRALQQLEVAKKAKRMPKHYNEEFSKITANVTAGSNEISFSLNSEEHKDDSANKESK